MFQKGDVPFSPPSDWTNMIIPGAERFSPGEQTMRWRLEGLGEEEEYECLVQVAAQLVALEQK